MIINYAAILLMSLVSSFAGFFMKKSTNAKTIVGIIKSKFLYIGGFLYVISALLNVWLLKQMPFSVVVPLGSMVYIWTMFVSGIFLKEKISLLKIAGVLLIISGVICIAI